MPLNPSKGDDVHRVACPQLALLSPVPFSRAPLTIRVLTEPEIFDVMIIRPIPPRLLQTDLSPFFNTERFLIAAPFQIH